MIKLLLPFILSFSLTSYSDSSHIINFIKKQFGIYKPKPVTPQLPVINILSGPYKGLAFAVEDLVYAESPIANIFDTADRFPELSAYVDLIAKRTLSPIYLTEFKKYRNQQSIENPHYTQEKLFRGRVFIGVLVQESKRVCVHQQWFGS